MAPQLRNIGGFEPFHPQQPLIQCSGVLSPMPPDAHERNVVPGTAGFQPALSDSARLPCRKSRQESLDEFQKSTVIPELGEPERSSRSVREPCIRDPGVTPAADVLSPVSWVPDLRFARTSPGFARPG